MRNDTATALSSGGRWIVPFRKVAPYVVRIRTSKGSGGTGFKVSGTVDGKWGISTASHVLRGMNSRIDSISIANVRTTRVVGEAGMMIDQEVTLGPGEYSAKGQPLYDTAIVVFDKERMDLPEEPILLADPTIRAVEGAEVAWCGFPQMLNDQLCFFSGHISAWGGTGLPGYFIDGVAIPGVSGGPVFTCDEEADVTICGFVSSYIPGKKNEKVLPGMSYMAGIQPIASYIKANTEKR